MDAANSTEQPRRKATAGSWKPGCPSPNPRGRPGRATSLTDAIRRGVDPDELRDIALDLARRGKSESTRIAALTWLRDSGFVKPAERHEVVSGFAQDGADELDLASLPTETIAALEALEAQRERILAAAVTATPTDPVHDVAALPAAPTAELAPNAGAGPAGDVHIPTSIHGSESACRKSRLATATQGVEIT